MKQRNPKGMGSFTRLKNGKCRWKKTIDGVTRQLYADSMQELEKAVKEVSDLPIVKNKYTVDEWFQKWLKTYVEALKKPATYNQYKDIYNKHIKPEIGARKITGIKTVDMQSIIATMNKKGLSTWTMKHARKIMSIAFKRAVKDKIIPVSPVDEIEIPNKQAKERKVLNPDELEKLFRQLERSRWQWAVKFSLVTGMRRGEILALRWTDIDYINNRITIDESNSVTGIGDTKTKIHYVPLSNKAREYLEKQKEMLEKEDNPILTDKKKKESCLIFPNESGVMLKPGSFYTMMARASKKAGIKATPHMLRHTFVYMTRGRLTLKELQNILGHDESTTTLDIYGDMITESAETIGTIDEVFKEIDKQKEVKQQANVIDFASRKKKSS